MKSQMLSSQHSITDPYCIVRKRKFDGSLKSEWEGELLPWLDEEWLVVLHHPARHAKFSGKAVQHSALLFLHYFNLTRPLTILAEYDRDGCFRGAKCDAALPATFGGNVIEFVDLDLDVIVEADSSWFVRDEVDFARNRKTMGYSQTVIAQALDGISLAQTLVTARRFPFDARFVPQLSGAPFI